MWRLNFFKQFLVGENRQKSYRYAAVSVINVALTQFNLWLFSLWLDSLLTNIVSVSLTAIPAFFLYKRWVWIYVPKSNLRKQILIFWLLTLAGLGLSTFTVWVATQWWEGFWSLALGNLSGFGIVWIGRFIILETYLFNHKNGR